MTLNTDVSQSLLSEANNSRSPWRRFLTNTAACMGLVVGTVATLALGGTGYCLTLRMGMGLFGSLTLNDPDLSFGQHAKIVGLMATAFGGSAFIFGGLTLVAAATTGHCLQFLKRPKVEPIITEPSK